MPPGSVVVVIVKGGAATVMLRACVSVAFATSFTWTVKFEVPTAVGVPLIVPLEERAIPDGRDPAVRDQVFPPDPPLAASVWLYAVLSVAFGSEVVVMTKGAGAIVRCRTCI